MRATLTYHSIDDSGSPVSVTPAAFAAHRRWLTSGRIRVVPLDEIATQPDGAPAVAVTFDDGLATAKEAIDSLLAEGLPVTIFAVTGHAGGTNTWGGRDNSGVPVLPLFDWAALERFAGRGAVIGAHTRRHHVLTRLADTALDDELGGCVADLRERLGVSTLHLAYPYGEVDDRIAGRAARWFTYGHTTELRVRAVSDAPLQLPRIDMYYFQRPGAVESWGTPAFARRLAWYRARRRLRARLLGGWAPKTRKTRHAPEP